MAPSSRSLAFVVPGVTTTENAMQRMSERTWGSDAHVARGVWIRHAALALALVSATALAEPRTIAPSGVDVANDVDGLFDFFPEWSPLGLVGEFAIGSRGGDAVAMSGD
ncbi:MAG: hypothetical protein ABW186_11000, partial [Rhodanobacteraceae bacterium]